MTSGWCVYVEAQGTDVRFGKKYYLREAEKHGSSWLRKASYDTDDTDGSCWPPPARVFLTQAAGRSKRWQSACSTARLAAPTRPR